LIARVAELEIRRRGCKLVDEAVDHIAQSSVFISLQVGLQVVFREAFVDLGFLQLESQANGDDSTSANGSSSSELSSPSYNTISLNPSKMQ
jgi:hypothetical protein